MTIEHSASIPAPLVVAREPHSATGDSLWRSRLREPLLHFVLIGLILFVAGELYRKHTDTYRIEVTPQRVAHLAKRYELQFGTAPNANVLRLLVDDDIHDEILFREGLALKLDQDDEIVRRRMVQKTQFLLQDTQAPAEPTNAELERYYDAHRTRYAIPERVSFSHVYFFADRGGESARERARTALGTLMNENDRAPRLGDPFPDLYDFAAYEAEQVTRLFGGSEFSEAVFAAPLAQWSGPYRSAYGWHLLRVAAREPARQAALSEVQAQVRADYLRDAQARANTAAFDEIARKFTVVRGQQ